MTIHAENNSTMGYIGFVGINGMILKTMFLDADLLKAGDEVEKEIKDWANRHVEGWGGVSESTKGYKALPVSDWEDFKSKESRYSKNNNFTWEKVA